MFFCVGGSRFKYLKYLFCYFYVNLLKIVHNAKFKREE